MPPVDFPSDPEVGDVIHAPNGYYYEWDGVKWHIVPAPDGGNGGGGGTPPTYVNKFNTRSGDVVLSLGDITEAGGAPSQSPAFGGVPIAPTADLGTSTRQLATTEFVMLAIGAGTGTGGGGGGAPFPEAPQDGAIYGRNGAVAGWREVLPIVGGELEGTLVLADDPVQPDEAATKFYVDNHIVDGGNF